MMPRRDLLRWMMLGLSGAALTDQLTLEASAQTSTQALPDEFLKRASQLNYDPYKLLAAFSRVKASYRSRNLASLWSISAVPLLVLDRGRRFEVKSLRQLRRLAPIVFAAKIRDTVAQCELAGLFLNSDGAMIGDGELWIKEACLDRSCRNSKFLVSTVDLFG